jgi:hypothetical protein
VEIVEAVEAVEVVEAEAEEAPELSPSTPIKSAVARAIIWNKELLFRTLYKESNHHYRAIGSWAVLVGVLRTPSFVPGLFLRHAARALSQEETPTSQLARKVFLPFC